MQGIAHSPGRSLTEGVPGLPGRRRGRTCGAAWRAWTCWPRRWPPSSFSTARRCLTQRPGCMPCNVSGSMPCSLPAQYFISCSDACVLCDRCSAVSWQSSWSKPAERLCGHTDTLHHEVVWPSGCLQVWDRPPILTICCASRVVNGRRVAHRDGGGDRASAGSALHGIRRGSWGCTGQNTLTSHWRLHRGRARARALHPQWTTLARRLERPSALKVAARNGAAARLRAGGTCR